MGILGLLKNAFVKIIAGSVGTLLLHKVSDKYTSGLNAERDFTIRLRYVVEILVKAKYNCLDYN